MRSVPSDTERVDWLLAVLSADDCDPKIADARAILLGAAIMLGKKGREAIDTAMENDDAH
jgi:hypothetical protein